MKKNGFFVIAMLVALFFWQWAYFSFKAHYSGLTEAKFQIEALKEQVQRAQVNASVMQWKLESFKIEVARLAPAMVKDLPSERQKEGRSLASVVQVPPEEFLTLAQFETSIDELRILFEKKQYKQVVRKAKNILALNPVSSSMTLVYFMLAESYYQTHDLELCFSTAQQMVQLFPDDEKTGYVLLRVGMFLKERNRGDEARNLFALVAHAFATQEDLKSKAERLLASAGGVE